MRRGLYRLPGGLTDYQARWCHSHHLISCPWRSRPSTSLDLFPLQEHMAQFCLMSACTSMFLSTTKWGVTPAPTFHDNFCLVSINNSLRSFLLFLSFPYSNPKPSEELKVPSPLLFYGTTTPSEFHVYHDGKLTSFDVFSSVSHGCRTGPPGLWHAAASFHSLPFSRNENFHLPGEWEPFLPSQSLAVCFFL